MDKHDDEVASVVRRAARGMAVNAWDDGIAANANKIVEEMNNFMVRWDVVCSKH